MPRKQQNNVLFDKELRNKYHIRKFSAGIASVLFGTFVYTSLDQQAQAAENTDTAVVNDATQTETNSDTKPTEPTNTQTNEPVPTPTLKDTTIQQPSVDHQTSEAATKPEPVAAPQVEQPAKAETTQTNASKADIPEETEPQTQTDASQVLATRAADTTDTTTEAPVQPITNTNAPAPAVNAQPVAKIEGIDAQVYTKEIPVYERSNAARTAGMRRGVYQARDSLGFIVPQNKKLFIRQAQGSNEADLRVDLMTNDRKTVRNATVSRNGSWTQISTTMDSAAFIQIPTGLNRKPVVEYYVEENAGVTLPTYHKGGDKAAFDADWAARNTSYGFVDGDEISFLIPNVDRVRIANLGQNTGPLEFKDLDSMIGYYEDIINHYNQWVGLNDDINSVHYNVAQKYFTIADAHGPGLAYYSTNNMGSNNPSMSGYLVKGWLALHEVGHGYDGVMTGDPKMNLIEIENNILANQYQTTIMGVKNGWAYEGRQESMQKDFHNRVMAEKMNFYNAGFRGSLDFMTKMVRLTGIEGFSDLWKGIRQEEADKALANKPFEQDVPRWITTYWLADNGINGTAYFDLYKVKMPQPLKDELDTYNNTFTYPLAALITNPEEQQRIKDKLGLDTIYELVKSSDLADTTVRENAQVNVNLNGQVLPDNVKVSLMEGTQEVASAEVVGGKATFPNLRAGVYKIVAPLSTTDALPESEYLVVREGADNQATLDYPKKDDIQNNVTQTISIRGLGNWEMVAVDYNPDTKQVTYKQNTGKPHLYFSDEYAHVTIQKADGTTVLDKSLIGNQSLTLEVQPFDLEFGDKVIVRHREQAARRTLVRNETKDNIAISKQNAAKETLTYTLTDKGFIVDGETQEDANRRYDEAIRSDVARIAEAINNHPERDYRKALFNVFTGVEHADPAVKAELLQTLNPLVAVYQVDTPAVNQPEAGATSISGTGEPESTITLTFANGQKAEVEVDKNGQWTTQLPEGTTLKHNDVTQLFATGKHGTVSETVSVKTSDTVAPAIPTINAIEAGTKEVSGTSEPLSKVTLTLPDGTTKVVDTNAEGNWSTTVEAPLVHDAVIKAVASDVADNKSPEATQTVRDTVVPAVPTINAVEAGTKEVSGTSEPLSKVTLTLPDGTTKVVDTDAQGVWSTELATPLVHDAVIKAVASDVADNKSREATQTVKDTVVPQVPTINAIEAGTKEVSGTSEPLSKVSLTLPDGTTKVVDTDAEGKWTTELATPLAHDAVVKAVVSDVAGNKSPEATQTVKDTKVPAVPTINAIEAGTKEVSGTSEPLSKVTLTLPDGTTKVIDTNAEGNWSTTVEAPLVHDAVIKAIASDVADNKSPEATQTVKDTKVPAVPTINAIEAGTKEVSGTSEPLSKVTLTLPDGTTKVVDTNAEGNWSTTVEAPLAHDAVIKAVASDVADNKSPEATQTVRDTVVPTVPTINAIEAGTKEVSGTSEPLSKVTLTLPDGTTKVVDTNAQGVWTTELTTPLVHNAVIKAVASDVADNKSPEATQTVKDTVVPAAPTINAVEAGTKEVSGTSESLSKVTLTLPDGTTKVVDTNAEGNWSTTVETPLAHDAVIKAVASDVAENKSPEATQTVRDTVVPTVPTINAIEAGTKEVSGTSEPLSKVTLTLPDATTKVVDTDAQGVWSTTLEAPLAHDAVIKAVASDVADNKSPETTQTVKDTKVPAVPTINAIEAGTQEVSGTSEPLSKVTLTLPDGTTKVVDTDAQGVWSTTLETPLAYDAVVKAVASDVAGNKSPEATQTVKDTVVPTVPTINAIEAGTKEVSGTSEPLSKVTLTLPDGTTKVVDTNAEGNWSTTVETPLAHDAVIKAVASDVAGNKSPEATLTVKDTVVPQVPTINAIEAGTKEVSGTSEPLSKVTLTLPDGTTKVVDADAQGVWSTTLEAPLAHDAVIKAVASDVAGNKSPEATLTVKDTVVPQVPTINAIEAGTKEVSGTSEPLSKVTLTLPDGTTKVVDTNAEGKWSTTLEAPLAHDAVIKAVVSDVAGNKSTEVSQTVKDTVAPAVPTINAIEAGTEEVSGTSEPLSKVTLTLPDGTTKVVETDAEGKWATEVATPLAHDAVIKAVASDVAGNKSPEATQTVKDTVAPKVPVVNEVKSTDQLISGTAESNSDVFVVLANDKVLKTKANAEGNWKVELQDSKSLVGNEIVKVYAKDLAENQSDTVESKVILVEVPTQPQPEIPTKPEAPVEEETEVPSETETPEEPTPEETPELPEEESTEPDVPVEEEVEVPSETETPEEPTPEETPELPEEESTEPDVPVEEDTEVPSETETPEEPTPEETPELPEEESTEPDVPVEEEAEVPSEVEPSEEPTLEEPETPIDEVSEVPVDETTPIEETSCEVSLDEGLTEVSEEAEDNNETDEETSEVTDEIATQNDVQNVKTGSVKHDKQYKKTTALNIKTSSKQAPSKVTKQTLPETGNDTSPMSLFGSLLTLLGLGFVVNRFNKKNRIKK
ncbi:Ig-like domain-containing protein [Staphylococcus simulans]